MSKDLLLITAITKEDGSTIEKLTLREPTAGDLDFAEATAKTRNGQTIILISRASGVNEKYVRALCARDYTAAAKYISSFLDDAPETGES